MVDHEHAVAGLVATAVAVPLEAAILGLVAERVGHVLADRVRRDTPEDELLADDGLHRELTFLLVGAYRRTQRLDEVVDHLLVGGPVRAVVHRVAEVLGGDAEVDEGLAETLVCLRDLLHNRIHHTGVFARRLAVDDVAAIPEAIAPGMGRVELTRDRIEDDERRAVARSDVERLGTLDLRAVGLELAEESDLLAAADRFLVLRAQLIRLADDGIELGRHGGHDLGHAVAEGEVGDEPSGVLASEPPVGLTAEAADADAAAFDQMRLGRNRNCCVQRTPPLLVVVERNLY